MATGTKAPKRSKEELFKERALTQGAIIVAAYSRLAELAGKGGYVADQIEKLYKQLDERAAASQAKFAPDAPKSETALEL